MLVEPLAATPPAKTTGAEMMVVEPAPPPLGMLALAFPSPLFAPPRHCRDHPCSFLLCPLHFASPVDVTFGARMPRSARGQTCCELIESFDTHSSPHGYVPVRSLFGLPEYFWKSASLRLMNSP